MEGKTNQLATDPYFLKATGKKERILVSEDALKTGSLLIFPHVFVFLLSVGPFSLPGHCI